MEEHDSQRDCLFEAPLLSAGRVLGVPANLPYADVTFNVELPPRFDIF